MATKKAAAAVPAQDRTLYAHNLYLNYLKPVSLGLVVSPNALRTAQIELPLQSPEAQKDLEATTAPVVGLEDDDAADPLAPGPSRALAGTAEFLTRFLGWKPELLELYRPGPDARMYEGQEADPAGEGRRPVPDALRHELQQYDDALEPSFAYRWPRPANGQKPWCLIGLEVPPGSTSTAGPRSPTNATGSSRPSGSSSACCTRPRSPSA
jgi:hypothetical protein